VDAVVNWLEHSEAPNIRFPNVAELFVAWLDSGELDDPRALVEESWKDIHYQTDPEITPAEDAA